MKLITLNRLGKPNFCTRPFDSDCDIKNETEDYLVVGSQSVPFSVLKLSQKPDVDIGFGFSDFKNVS